MQVYLAPVKRAEDEPVQQLRGFEKIFLEPGDTKKVEVEVEISGKEKDVVEVRIGSSSRDIRITRVL